ncbi:SMP-30/gluconolactonase/LRE family protein [Blastococcus sp. SYSU D00695]
MAERELRTVLTGGGFFEGPRWRDGTWWVSDFYRHTVSRVTPAGEETVLFEVENQPSGLGWLADGSLVVVSMRDRRLLRWADGELSTYADLSEHCGGHLNDLVVDERGRVFAGDFGFDLMSGDAPSATTLKRVDPDGSVHVVADGLEFPNGMVITPDGGTLVVGETLGNRYTAFDLAEDGTLSNRREWAALGPEATGGAAIGPDGCTLDAEGHIWTADADGGRVARLAPGGAIVESVPAPDGMGVFACMLGGEDGTTLLVCCAPDYLEHHRAPVREAVLVATEVGVARAGRP